MTIEEKGKPVSDADRQMLNARVEQAGELFGSGYNCSQSVVAAFADLYGVERELALRMSAPSYARNLRCCMRTFHAGRTRKRIDRGGRQKR